MKKIIAMLLCAGMVLSFTACQDTPDNSGNSAGQESSVQTEEENQDQQVEESLNEYGMPMSADSMLTVAEALVSASYLTDLEYAVWNTEFIWMACSMLVGSGGIEGLNTETSGEYVYVSSGAVKQCINAMFAGFDANTDELPEIPEGMNVVYDEATDRYGFALGDYGDQTLKVLEWTESGSNGIDMKVALFGASDDQQFSGIYDVFMNGTTYEGAEPLFQYMVASFVMTDPAPSQSVAGEGDISKEEALSLVEDKYGADGQPDPDTGNIIGYGYEGIVEVNGVNYHNFRMTWLVMNESGEADHSSYIQNIFVSLDGLKVIEGYRYGDSWEFTED